MATTRADDESDPLRAALAALRVERRRVVDEREAFRAFRDRVSSIPAADGVTRRDAPANGSRAVGGNRPHGGGTWTPTRGAAVPGSGLAAVRDAYQETVMAVPHYEAEYDDTYERSLAAEFGPELAYALTRTAGFHAEYRRSLLDAVDTAAAERDAFCDALATETESVERAASRLAPVRDEVEAIDGEVPGRSDSAPESASPGFGALDACRARVEALRDDCDRIAARRQRVIADHDRSLALPDDLDLPTYCYHDLDASYPVLAAIGRTGDRLDALRRRIERAIARAE